MKDAEVAIVANGFAVKLFVEKANLRLKDRLKELNERGVKFYVCNDALNLHLPSCSGWKFVELQNQGYVYVKP